MVVYCCFYILGGSVEKAYRQCTGFVTSSFLLVGRQKPFRCILNSPLGGSSMAHLVSLGSASIARSYPPCHPVIYNRCMSFVELWQMSQKREQNIYAQTDQLYEPLRNALRKSTVSQSLLFSDLKLSRVGRNLRSLSPAQAELIKRNIYIPVNKQLIPTRNIQKVLGKKFTAVDVNEKVREALSPEEFSRMRLGTTDEIIYEIRDQPQRNGNLYTSRADGNVSQSPFKNLRNLNESNVEQFHHPRSPISLNLSPVSHRQSQFNIVLGPNRQSRLNQLPLPDRQSQININPQVNRQSQTSFHPQQTNRQSQVSFRTQPQQQISFASQLHRQSQLHFIPQPNPSAQLNYSTNRQNLPNIYLEQPHQPPLPHQISPQNTQNQRQSLVLAGRSNNHISSPVVARHESSKQTQNKSITSITAMRNDLNLNENLLLSQVKSGTQNSSKLYDFKTSKISGKTNRISKRSKEEYKYNLFNAFDQAGNTNCRNGCFNSNEIVASKIQNNPWK